MLVLIKVAPEGEQSALFLSKLCNFYTHCKYTHNPIVDNYVVTEILKEDAIMILKE